MNITHDELAEVLAGIARSQAAVLNAVFGKETLEKKVRPALLREAKFLDGESATLESLYPGALLMSLNGVPPSWPLAREILAPQLASLLPKA